MVGAVPWGHHLLVLDKVPELRARLYYLRATAQLGWSRNVLLNQIKAGAFERAVQERKTHNFDLARQYNIRAVPAAIDRALRRRAREEEKSLNTVAVEALGRGLELDAPPREHTDLDALIGSWQPDPAFDRAVAEFSKVDVDAWK